ncbi:MAG: terminase small subunit [Rubrimonas sp.]
MDGGAVFLNKHQLADAFGVSPNTIDQWRKAGMPVVAQGSNGRAYAFDPAACRTWRETRERRRAEEQASAEELVAQLRLELDPVASARRETLSPAEQREVYEAAARFMAVARQRRELVEADQVVAMLEGALAAIRDAVDALPDHLARELGLTGEQTETVVRYCDDALSSARLKLAALIDGED